MTKTVLQARTAAACGMAASPHRQADKEQFSRPSQIMMDVLYSAKSCLVYLQWINH